MLNIIVWLSFFLGFVMVDIGHSQGASVRPQSDPVTLDDLGPGSIAPLPRGFPAGNTLRQKQFLLRNLSSQDILFYTIAYVNERGTIVSEMGRASYPPDHPSVVAQGAIENITKRYVDNGGTLNLDARIDSVVFADGSSFGPNILHRKEAYAAVVEARYLEAQNILEILETQGPEALRELLRRRLRQPNPLLPMSTSQIIEASRQKLGIGKDK